MDWSKGAVGAVLMPSKSRIWEYASVACAANVMELLHPRVGGREVVVSDRPVDTDAIATRGREFMVRHPKANASPRQRSPSDLASTDPHEWFVVGRGVGMLTVVDEQLGVGAGELRVLSLHAL
jgi:hypothetical protein